MTYALPIYNIQGKHCCTEVNFKWSDVCWSSPAASAKMYLEFQNIFDVNFPTQSVAPNTGEFYTRPYIDR